MDLSQLHKFDTCRGKTLFLPNDLPADKVKSYQNVRSPRGCMQCLTRWAGTALPNTSLGQTGNKCSILADKEFASHPMFTPRKQKKVI